MLNRNFAEAVSVGQWTRFSVATFLHCWRVGKSVVSRITAEGNHVVYFGP